MRSSLQQHRKHAHSNDLILNSAKRNLERIQNRGINDDSPVFKETLATDQLQNRADGKNAHIYNRYTHNSRSETKNKIPSKNLAAQTENNPTEVVRRQVGGIAFSTYLDHDVDLGKNQVLKFNKIITNEGNGYNVHTGAFICPEGGMYLLTFYVGERGTSVHVGAWISLMVNSVNVIDAASDAYHSTQDLQGGNSVIIRLKTGDVVFVNNGYGHTHHAEGSPGLRLTSFSGVMLFS